MGRWCERDDTHASIVLQVAVSVIGIRVGAFWARFVCSYIHLLSILWCPIVT